MHHIKKKALNKSCLELNFVQKSLSAYVYLPPGWSQWPWKIGMFEVLFCRENVTKNTHHIKKSLKSFRAHGSTPVADKQMRSQNFLDNIQFRTTFI